MSSCKECGQNPKVCGECGQEIPEGLPVSVQDYLDTRTTIRKSRFQEAFPNAPVVPRDFSCNHKAVELGTEVNDADYYCYVYYCKKCNILIQSKWY